MTSCPVPIHTHTHCEAAQNCRQTTRTHGRESTPLENDHSPAFVACSKELPIVIKLYGRDDVGWWGGGEGRKDGGKEIDVKETREEVKGGKDEQQECSVTSPPSSRGEGAPPTETNRQQSPPLSSPSLAKSTMVFHRLRSLEGGEEPFKTTRTSPSGTFDCTSMLHATRWSRICVGKLSCVIGHQQSNIGGGAV